MSCVLTHSRFLKPWKSNIIPIRTRRVNVQRPRPPFYTRALFEAMTKPYYKLKDEIKLPPSMTCLRNKEKEEDDCRPDNPYEKLIAKEALSWFNKSKLIGFVHTNPVAIQDKFDADLKYKRLNMTVKIYSHHTLKIALKNTVFEAALVLFKSHTAIVFGDNSADAGKLVSITKKIPQYVLLAAVVEGTLLSVSQLEAFSRLGSATDVACSLVATLNAAMAAPSSALTCLQTNLVSTLQLHADTNLKT